jgi:hypothetical protein
MSRLSSTELGSVAIPDPPFVDRFSPNCLSTIIESSARYRYGLPDICKAWFSYSFVYERPLDEIGFAEDGMALNVLLSNIEEYTNYRGEKKLAHYYGLRLEDTEYDDFHSMLSDVHAAIASRELVITSFDIAYIPKRREYRRSHSEHLVSPFGLDMARGTVAALDNLSVDGRVEFGLLDYRDCFDYVRSQGAEFLITRCPREANHVELPVRRSELRQDLQVCLDNLLSAHPNRGLNALRRAITDVSDCARRMAAPFAVPGFWMFERDRHNLALQLRHWRGENLARADLLGELEQILEELFRTWGAVNVITEGALAASVVCDANELDMTLQRILRLEERAVAILEIVFDGLCD